MRSATRSKITGHVLALARLSKRIAANPKAGAVHRLRTTVRRMETLLSRCGEEPDRAERKLLKQLTRIRRHAGKVRDLDIQMKVLDSLKPGVAARERGQVLRALKKAAEKRRRRLVLVLEEESARGLEKRLRRLEARMTKSPSSQPPSSGTPPRDETDVLNLALEQFAELVQAHGTLTEENLHDFRMGTKRVRYLAEAAGHGLEARSAVAQLKRIQDAIGSWHDCLTLVHTAEKVLGTPAASPLLVALRRMTHARFLKALRITADAVEHLGELRRPLGARKPPRPAGARRQPRRNGMMAATFATLWPGIDGVPSPLAALHGDGHIRRS